jgi:23S rRNA pseudouridine2604 synthase
MRPSSHKMVNAIVSTAAVLLIVLNLHCDAFVVSTKVGHGVGSGSSSSSTIGLASTYTKTTLQAPFHLCVQKHHDTGNGNEDSSDRHHHPYHHSAIRLNKVFKASFSRRQADDLIESGRVAVNGLPVTERGGFKVQPFYDVVTLDGITVEGWEVMNGIVLPDHQQTGADDGFCATIENGKMERRTTRSQNEEASGASPSQNLEYIKYWKPQGVICTTDNTVCSNIVDDLVHKRGYSPKHRFFPVGRLDKDTSGLILLTSDGRLPNSVLRGQFKQPKVYRVLVNREIHCDDLQLLREGVVITTVAQRDGNRQGKLLTAPTLPCHINRIPHTQRRGVTMTLVEGRNRQIRKMMEALGYEVIKLHRVQFMGITLDPLQRAGEWVHLAEDEMRLVREAIRRAETTSQAQ